VIAGVVIKDCDELDQPSQTEKLSRLRNPKETLEVAYNFNSSSFTLKYSRMAIVEYFSKILRWLNLNLCNKAESYTDLYLKYIFLLNNYYKVSKLFSNSEMESMFSLHTNNDSSDQLNNKNSLLELFSIAGKPNFKETYDSDILKFKQEYYKSWNKLVTILDFKVEPIVDGKIKEKDRQIAKERFTGFNKEFEEAINTQAKYFIPNNELADDLRTRIINLILARYKPFHDIYDNSNFATHKDKYIKYKPEDVKAKIKYIFCEC